MIYTVFSHTLVFHFIKDDKLLNSPHAFQGGAPVLQAPPSHKINPECNTGHTLVEYRKVPSAALLNDDLHHKFLSCIKGSWGICIYNYNKRPLLSMRQGLVIQHGHLLYSLWYCSSRWKLKCPCNYATLKKLGGR